MTERVYARSFAIQIMQIVLVVSPILSQRNNLAVLFCSQLVVREGMLAKTFTRHPLRQTGSLR
jgi:hypothetical protein